MAVLRIVFFAYVIGLAGYVTIKAAFHQRWGSQQVAFAPPLQQCFEPNPDWTYCIHKNAKTDDSSYLYVFHGRGQNEQMWMEGNNYGAQVQSVWQHESRRTPMVITISFGDTWFISKAMSKPNTGLLERFQNEVLPTIEDKWGTPKSRFLVGNSMGALNAISLSLAMPKHFSRVAALCPPLFFISPFNHWKDIVEFLRRTGARPQSTITIMSMGRYLFANDQEWQSFNPLNLVQQTAYRSYNRFYITAGLRDEFGLFEGTRQFVDDLRKAGAEVEWRPNSGDHCSVDALSLAQFLSL